MKTALALLLLISLACNSHALRCHTCVASDEADCNRQGSAPCPQYADACSTITGPHTVIKSCTYKAFCDKAAHHTSTGAKMECCFGGDCNGPHGGHNHGGHNHGGHSQGGHGQGGHGHGGHTQDGHTQGGHGQGGHGHGGHSQAGHTQGGHGHGGHSQAGHTQAGHTQGGHHHNGVGALASSPAVLITALLMRMACSQL